MDNVSAVHRAVGYRRRGWSLGHGLATAVYQACQRVWLANRKAARVAGAYFAILLNRSFLTETP